jgi:hypothetical protein
MGAHLLWRETRSENLAARLTIPSKRLRSIRIDQILRNASKDLVIYGLILGGGQIHLNPNSQAEVSPRIANGTPGMNHASTVLFRTRANFSMWCRISSFLWNLRGRSPSGLLTGISA